MNERPTLDAVRAAIKTALTDTSNPDRKAASDWLDNLKSSPFAWEICDQLLASRESIAISYLAAHMLRHKIYKNFNELPLECYASLKDSILNHLKANEDYGVQGQLTMAISDLTLLLRSWQNPIEELAQKLNLDQTLTSINLSDYNAIYTALHHRVIFADILHQMCDLNHNHTERPSWVGSRRREEFEDYLISKCGQAITWWLSTLQQIEELKIRLHSFGASGQSQSLTESDKTFLTKSLEAIDKLIGQIYLCFSAWLRIFDEQNMTDSLAILDSAFKVLIDTQCSDKVHNYAVEVVISVANYSEDLGLEYMISHLVNNVYTLEPAFRESVNKEDVGKSCNFVRIFSSVAETGCRKFVIEERDFKLVELLLSCMNHYDYEIVEETYHFWWTFLELLQVNLNPNDYVHFIPLINRFVMSVTKLCQFDPDEDSVVPNDQDIHSFRADSAELINSVLFITDVESFLRDNQIIDNFRQPLKSIAWEKLEAILYLITCLTQMLTNSDNQLRMQLFQLVISQQVDPENPNVGLTDWPTNVNVNINIGSDSSQVHPQIVATTLQIIGTLEGLLNESQECLAISTNYILNAMNNPAHCKNLMKYSAASLVQITEVQAARNFGNYPDLLKIIKDLCSNLDNYESASGDLLKVASFLAQSITDSQMSDQFICEIVNHHLNIIKNSLEQQQSGKQNNSIRIKCLDRLSVFLRQLRLTDSKVLELTGFTTLVDNTYWPLIVKVLETCASADIKIIDASCRTIRFVIRSIRPEWMIERIAETMINLYKSYPQDSSPLYICSILVDEFANRSAEINSGLFKMLEIFCQLSFTLLDLNASQQQSLLTMKSYPETIDDMMRLFVRFLQNCPEEFLACPALANIIELSISSLRIDHQDANASVTKFLTAFVTCHKGHQHISEALKNVLGAKITDAVIRACLFDIPSTLITDEAQILLLLYGFDKNLFSLWVEASVKSLPRVNIQGIESVTEDEMDDFKKTISTTGTLKGLVNCLRAFARSYT